MALTKFDVLLYIELNPGTRESLANIIRENALFEKVSNRAINACIRNLNRGVFIVEKKRELKINKDNKKIYNCLAFIHWARMNGVDYNSLMKKNIILIFKEILNGCNNMANLSRKTKLSKPVLLNAIKILSQNNFIEISRKKPIMMKANLNDLTFFYINFNELSLKIFEKQFNISKIQKIHTGELIEKLIELHTYSTTVTEGNTATEYDVKKVFGNYPVNLTPKEITEILNTKRAVERLYEVKNEEINEDGLKNIHKILMFNLLHEPGEFYYGQKRIIGSDIKPPDSIEEIESSIKALLNFINFYNSNLNPIILAPITHFMFVTIHLFADGNGRMARLLHSWIHLKYDLPLFVFDPNRKNKYFDVLETGRKKSVDDFIVFCIDGMADMLNKVIYE